MAKRRVKPRVLVLSTSSERSVSRLLAALAVTENATPDEWKLRNRARTILALLRAMA